MSKSSRPPGRNEPCSCGSGLKYKRCCLQRIGADRAEAIGERSASELDADLAHSLLTFGRRHHGADRIDPLLEVRGAKLEASELENVVIPCVAYMERFDDGWTLPERYLREGLARDAWQEAFLAAQQQAWLSIWQVTAVRPGEGFDLRDLLTGERRSVSDARASRTVALWAGILVRVVESGGACRLSGIHPNALSPLETDSVLGMVRKVLAFGAKVRPEKLREGKTARRLVWLWTLAAQLLVEEVAEVGWSGGDKRPEYFRASYLFLPAQRDELRQALLGLEGVEPVPGGESAEEVFHLGWLDIARLRWTLGVVLRLREDSLILETCTRADEQRTAELVEHCARGLVRRQGLRQEATEGARLRWDAEFAKGLPGLRDREDLADPLVVTNHLRAMVEEELAVWPDAPHPALGGLSSREAARDSASRRRQAETELAELEHGHSQLPACDRHDFSALRRELFPGE